MENFFIHDNYVKLCLEVDHDSSIKYPTLSLNADEIWNSIRGALQQYLLSKNFIGQESRQLLNILLDSDSGKFF